MSRRKVGVGRLKAEQARKEKLSTLGKTMESEKSSSVVETLGSFKDCLSEFAGKHRKKINEDPEFRMQFHRMCQSVGVDPLASSKGFWSNILGYGDFYFELGVVIIQICLQTRNSNGGLLSFAELMDRLKQRSKSQGKQVVSADDVKSSVDKLVVLGGGFRIIKVGSRDFVLSTPLEINTDHEVFIDAAQELQATYGSAQSVGVTQGHFNSTHGWSAERFELVLAPLLREGIVWVDGLAGGASEPSYHFPMIFTMTSGVGDTRKEG